jgi:hypothetical protein
MSPLTKLLLACSISLGIYGVASQVIRKPLTIDEMVHMIAVKRKLAQSAEPPRLFVLAGSNGRFSHRAETMQPIIGRPAINLSLVAGIGPDYLFANYENLFRSGDAVYLPLEYSQYLLTEGKAFSGPDRIVMIQRERALLFRLGWARVVRAFFAFDLSFFIQGTGEMALQARGVTRRFGLDTLSPNGDESGHTREKGQTYKDFINSVVWPGPDAEGLGKKTFGKELIAQFVRRLKNKGVQIIGGLPTTFADHPPSEEAVNALRNYYTAELGTEFLVLTNRSTYPRECFYDTAYHLNEESQIAHSIAVATELRRVLR